MNLLRALRGHRGPGASSFCRPCQRLFLFLTLLAFVTVNGCLGRSKAPKGSEDPASRPSSVQCRDEDGNPVPWFIAYKLPKIRAAAAGPTFRQGTGYSFILPTSSKWDPSTKAIGDRNSVVGQTLKPFFRNVASSSPSLFTLVYNDQPAFRDDFGYNGHAKGVLIGGGLGQGALWLVHSVPKFPAVPPVETRARANDPDGLYNFYPSTGLTNAQMFLCLTLSGPSELDELTSSVFRLIRPHVNNTTLPEELKAVYPKMKEFLAIKRFSSRGPVSCATE